MTAINQITINLDKAKRFLILFALCFITNLAFKATKIYIFYYYENFESREKILDSVIYDEKQYDSLLKVVPIADFYKVGKAVEIKYLYLFPEESIMIIYLGYFIAAAGLISSIQNRRETN